MSDRSDSQLTTPVALLIFNRPDTTQQVFEAIRQAKPTTLLVVADGPRPDRPQEAEKCAAARAVVEQVDWDCNVLKHYSDVNLGCGTGPATGINWVFEQVETAIILEDDCVPHVSFFEFCQELLEKYRDDSRIAAIAGWNGQKGEHSEQSYYFSRYLSTWGWATWRRAWRYFDFEMQQLPELQKNKWLETYLQNKKAAKCWGDIFQRIYTKDKQSSWDYQWQLACWLQDGLCIRPNTNLILNIGFGADATHTKDPNQAPTLASEAIDFPLKHPASVTRDRLTDEIIQKHMLIHCSTELIPRVKRKIKKILSAWA